MLRTRRVGKEQAFGNGRKEEPEWSRLVRGCFLLCCGFFFNCTVGEGSECTMYEAIPPLAAHFTIVFV